MKARQRFVIGLVVLGVTIASAYLVGRACAAGVPTTQPLTYSGVLTDAAGVPLTGATNLQVQVWDSATVGTMACATDSVPQNLVLGSFAIPLPAACATAIHTTPDLWIELLVNGGATPRIKMGAVPYALEADHATSAATAVAAAANGSIDTRLKAVEGVTPLTQVTAMTMGPESFSDTDSKGHLAACNAGSAFNAVECGVVANRFCISMSYKGGFFVGESGDGSHRSVVCIK